MMVAMAVQPVTKIGADARVSLGLIDAEIGWGIFSNA